MSSTQTQSGDHVERDAQPTIVLGGSHLSEGNHVPTLWNPTATSIGQTTLTPTVDVVW